MKLLHYYVTAYGADRVGAHVARLTPPLGEAALVDGFEGPGPVLVIALPKDAPQRPGAWTNADGSVRVGPGLFAVSGVSEGARTIERANGVPPALVEWVDVARRVVATVRTLYVFENAGRAWALLDEDADADLTTRDGTRLYQREGRCVFLGDVPPR